MDEFTIQAPAKLNLTLDVLGRREDGYHDLKMVMQSITLADRLTLRPGRAPGIQVSSSFHFLPTGEKNLAGKAAVCFYQALGRPARDLDISITKHVPVCAGMAGGSSDAAAVLRALNRLEGDPFSPEELAHVGEAVGSDVPYCVLGCTALAQGRGEVLTPLSPLPHCWVVACKPDFPVSTPELFARIDSCRIRRRPDADGLMAALEQGDLMEVARRMYNVFEDVLPERQLARVADIKNTLIQQGALGANMSGTGPTAFGLFSSQSQAQAAYDVLKQRYQEVFLAETV
ncbi:4-(cytidine 5'-diphospho)-2-C-methyl-D-erythritol kinase [Flintibacter faecis]|uniref:4-diphosphocytidyl-2-C-methyl-D-erythritol kinase n=1 Tax=Flintibacter faecis TaxID=2763047 RepID=A0A8J6IYY3_9FIRM|nr:4-(cytidine 5'-diphospho)-2-C-methyl-D-erythritol kinase [Flintibacter faecis]MBC5716698.1 4-(cytidine 5'-diphospho)-2-C-methyl-D-erythritol kinase [Flintibacter faecis]